MGRGALNPRVTARGMGDAPCDESGECSRDRGVLDLRDGGRGGAASLRPRAESIAS